jgi:hypothetical protein
VRMARHEDLHVIEPEPADESPAGGRPGREPPPRSRLVRPAVALVLAAGAAILVVATVVSNALFPRPSHPGPAPAAVALSACDAIPAPVVAKLLGAPHMTATSQSGGVCTWASPLPLRSALVVIQVYDAPVEAKAAFQNEEAQSPNWTPWRFADDAFTEAYGVHASGVALVGTATIIADANGLAATGADVAAAQRIVEMASAWVRQGHLPRSSSLPLP